MDVNTESVLVMAVKLHERLMKEEKFLLILDDVWEKIDFTFWVSHGVKFILVVRSYLYLEVWESDMEFDDNVKMKGLSDKDALQLFCEKAKVLNDEEIRPFAEKLLENVADCHWPSSPWELL